MRTASFRKMDDVETKSCTLRPSSMFRWRPHACNTMPIASSGLRLEDETTSSRFD